MMQTQALNIGEYIQGKQANVLTLSVPAVDRQNTSNSCLNFYPEYNGIDLSPSDRKIIQSITVLYESWQIWQRHILFSGLIHRFGKTQLKNLKTAVESLCHRDFIAVCKNAYPMHKIKERQSVRFCDIRRLAKKYSTPTEIAIFLAQNDNNFNTAKSGKMKSHFGKKTKPKRVHKHIDGESSFGITHETAQTTPAISQGVSTRDELQTLINFDKLSSSKKKVAKQSSMISLPSVWEMGEGAQELGDAESDFESRVSPVNKPEEAYFPQIASHTANAKFATTSSKVGLDQFMKR